MSDEFEMPYSSRLDEVLMVAERLAVAAGAHECRLEHLRFALKELDAQNRENRAVNNAFRR